jgi:hypothetical protein
MVAVLSLGADGTVEVRAFPTGQSVPVAPGPYRFAGPAEAGVFLDEAVEALSYLGCEIS